MLVYYELSDIRGTSNSYLVTNPSNELNSDVQDLLVHEYMVSQVLELYLNHINMMNYINKTLPNVENENLAEIFNLYLRNIDKLVLELKPIISGQLEEETEIDPVVKENKTKNWKKDLSFARSVQTMSGYIMNFYAPVQNLSSKLGYDNLSEIILHLHQYTQQLHESVTRISMNVVKNKFIN